MIYVGLWLAAYRVTRLLVADTVLAVPRTKLLTRYPPTTWLGSLLTCYWCIGFWTSGLTVLVLWLWAGLPLPVLWWFAISAAVGLTGRNLDG